MNNLESQILENFKALIKRDYLKSEFSMESILRRDEYKNLPDSAKAELLQWADDN